MRRDTRKREKRREAKGKLFILEYERGEEREREIKRNFELL